MAGSVWMVDMVWSTARNRWNMWWCVFVWLKCFFFGLVWFVPLEKGFWCIGRQRASSRTMLNGSHTHTHTPPFWDNAFRQLYTRKIYGRQKAKAILTVIQRRHRRRKAAVPITQSETQRNGEKKCAPNARTTPNDRITAQRLEQFTHRGSEWVRELGWVLREQDNWAGEKIT